MSWVAGIDEAGRGPLAGPVVAAAVILDPSRPRIRGLRDSKQLSAAQRRELAGKIRERALGVAVAIAEVDEIDRLNILQATLLAMKRALLALSPRPARVLIDGNRAPCLDEYCSEWHVETVIGGDDLVPCISAASIIAKTYRDGLMSTLDHTYPGYGLSLHFGYATPAHLQALQRLGPSPLHRRSFAPVRASLDDNCDWDELLL